MKGLPRSLARALPGVATTPIVKQTIAITNRALAVADGIPGFGSVVIGDFPEGNILLLGAIVYIQLSSVDADVIAAFSGNYSVGSAPTADNALAGADVDVIPSTALAAAIAGVSPLTRGANATQVLLDNTDGSLELNLNVLIADASISGAGDFLVNGVAIVSYVVLGDD